MCYTHQQISIPVSFTMCHRKIGSRFLGTNFYSDFLSEMELASRHALCRPRKHVFLNLLPHCKRVSIDPTLRFSYVREPGLSLAEQPRHVPSSTVNDTSSHVAALCPAKSRTLAIRAVSPAVEILEGAVHHALVRKIIMESNFKSSCNVL